VWKTLDRAVNIAIIFIAYFKEGSMYLMKLIKKPMMQKFHGASGFDTP
jgi:hypothetical protein